MSDDPSKKRRSRWMIVLFVLMWGILISGLWPLAKRNFDAAYQINATKSLITAITTAIAIYEPHSWTWSQSTASGPQAMNERMWDLNHDGLIDGLPAVTASDTTDGGFSPELIASGYAGGYHMIRPPISTRFVTRRQQLIDAWGQPLRIAYAEAIYGVSSYGIWSLGPDGIDGTPDDLKSWDPAP